MIVRGMPFPEYLAHPALGSGAIRQYLQSPAHYRHYLQTRGEPPTPAMLLGSAIHCAVLEPREFNARYVKAIDMDRRTKAGKAEWLEFVERNQGKVVLTSEQYDTAWAVRDTLLAMPEYRAVSNGGIGDVEVSAFWTDPETGLELKARADSLDGMATCIDLKSAADASPHGFAGAIARYRYHIQAAMYLEAFGCERFIFVAAEKNPPFAAGVYTLDEASVQQGRDEYRRALRGIAEHQQKDTWPSYGAQEISLPGWAFDWDNDGEVIV
jgi:hypothetical protein